MKIVFVASIIRNSLCIFYVFYLLFSSKINFYWKLFSNCCDQFGFLGSIVYLSCLISNDIFGFWHHHISGSWRSLKVLEKVIFWADHALFLPLFVIYKWLLGVCCKSGDLCWHGFVCWFWIYIVVRLDIFFHFFKKCFRLP